MHNRSLGSVAFAPFDRRHWIAFFNTFRVIGNPLEHLREYLWRGSAQRSETCAIATPTGNITAQMFNPDDRLTVNEIFCRLDYRVGNDLGVFVDFGANIGLASLFFLTRNHHAVGVAVEPNPQNLAKLQQQLAGYGDRLSVLPIGVADQSGVLEFGFEPTGRYGGAGLDFADRQQIEVLSANQILSDVLRDHDRINVLKMDIESMEEDILRSLEPEILERIDLLLVEGAFPKSLLADTHRQRVYGSITRFERRA